MAVLLAAERAGLMDARSSARSRAPHAAEEDVLPRQNCTEDRGIARAAATLLYARTMSRWDPKPTPVQRWIVRHRRGHLVVSVVYLVVAIGLFVYCLVTSQLTVSIVLNAIVAIGLTIQFVYISRDIARLIEKSDSTHDSGPS